MNTVNAPKASEDFNEKERNEFDGMVKEIMRYVSSKHTKHLCYGEIEEEVKKAMVRICNQETIYEKK